MTKPHVQLSSKVNHSLFFYYHAPCREERLPLVIFTYFNEFFGLKHFLFCFMELIIIKSVCNQEPVYVTFPEGNVLMRKVRQRLIGIG